MPLSDFFRINLPYGIKRNSQNQWFAFNREYVPIGYNTKILGKDIFMNDSYTETPIYTEYKGLTDDKLLKIAGKEEAVNRDSKGKINCIFLYNDRTNPQSAPQYWNDYLEKIKLLSTLMKK